MKCTYKKTYNGVCDQEASVGLDLCYYHTKVVNGLIESDPILSMRQSPTIRIKE